MRQTLFYWNGLMYGLYTVYIYIHMYLYEYIYIYYIYMHMNAFNLFNEYNTS